jgi:hypothetical protein
MDSLPSLPDRASQSYPCPCHRHGQLVPIYLTEAFGCDRCPRMFVLESDGRLVQQRIGSEVEARSWRWVGQDWQLIAPPPGDRQQRSLRRIGLALLLLVVGWGLFGQWLVAPWRWLYWGLGLALLIGLLSQLGRPRRRR